MGGVVEDCCAEGCEAQVLRPRLFCMSHWLLLPDWLAHEIGRAHLAEDDEAVESLVRQARRLLIRLERWLERHRS